MPKPNVKLPQRCMKCLCRQCKHDCFMCDKLCEWNPYDKEGLKGIEQCQYFESPNILYKGVFWIKNFDEIKKNDTFFKIECNRDGIIKNMDSYDLNIIGKSGNTINHEKLWATLPKSVTNNKPFDYYPRGRVEISNGKAKIFIAQYLIDYKNDIMNLVKDKFNLFKENGINEVTILVDGSEHYKPKMEV